MTVESGGVSLAVTDHGGSGPDLLLMHGLGASQRSMLKLVRLLTGWRVVTMDGRGHGRSTTGPFTFDSAVADAHAVVQQLGLQQPVVGGHSLGGMVALRYALAGHPAAGVVNIDGWGPGVPDRYVGEDATAVAAWLDRVAEGDLSSRLSQVLSSVSRQSREGTTAAVLRLLDRTDVVAWHAAAPCPSLAVQATRPAAGLAARAMGRDGARRLAAHHDGLRRDLAALAAANPLVTVVELPEATHALVSTHPQQVASAIDAWRADL